MITKNCHCERPRGARQSYSRIASSLTSFAPRNDKIKSCNCLEINGFTLIEILMVVAAIGILAGIVIVAINPGRQLAAARNTRRQSDTASIAQALYQYSLDHDGALPDSITAETKMIGTSATGCAVTCGPTVSSLSTGFSASDADKSAFDQGSYANTQYDSAKDGVALASGTTGTFVSSVKNSDGANTNWSNITWTQTSPSPSNKELPDNNARETGFQSGNVDMTGNVLLLHLNEESGARTFTDASSSHHVATCGGTICPTMGTSGKFNTAGSFDGLNDHIQVKDTPALKFTGGEMTISIWMKPNVAENNGSRIISKPWNGNGEYNYWIEYYQGRASFCAGVIYSRFSCVVAPNQPIVGVWNHIVATANSSTMKIFLNGVEEKSKNYSITDWKPGYDINRALAIGTLYPYWTEWPGLTGFSFKGEIDEVAIFTRVLSPTEVLDFYRRGAAGLKFQTRSCADDACSSSSFSGPDGTTGTFYSGAANSSAESSLSATLNLPANRFFQYKSFFNAANPDSSPALLQTGVSGTIPPPSVSADSIGIPTADSCVDLTPVLAGTYLTDLPTDPSLGSAEKTFYAISRNDKGVVTITSCASENSVIIQAKQ